jgi:hypothetical protein
MSTFGTDNYLHWCKRRGKVIESCRTKITPEFSAPIGIFGSAQIQFFWYFRSCIWFLDKECPNTRRFGDAIPSWSSQGGSRLFIGWLFYCMACSRLTLKKGAATVRCNITTNSSYRFSNCSVSIARQFTRIDP